MSSQIINQLNIRHFRLILPSSLCISLWPSRLAIASWRTQCPTMNFFNNTVAKFLKQDAPVLLRDRNSDPTGSVQNPNFLSPTMLPLNPFQSFVLHGTVACGTTRSDNSDLYPHRSMFGELKPTINERSATNVGLAPLKLDGDHISCRNTPKRRHWNES